MTDSFKVFKNIRSLRAAARAVPFDEFKGYVEKINAVFAEIQDEEAEKEKVEQQKQDKIKEYLDLLQQDNITPDELQKATANTNKGAAKSGSKAPPKYKFITESGEERTWNGRGRTPTELKARLDAGEELESFLIK